MLHKCFKNYFTTDIETSSLSLSKTYHSLGSNHHSCFKLKKISITVFLITTLATNYITRGQVFGSFLYTLSCLNSCNITSTAFLMASGIPTCTRDPPEARSDLGHCLQVQRLSSDKISVCLPIALTHVWPPLHSTEHVQLLCSLTALQRQS